MSLVVSVTLRRSGRTETLTRYATHTSDRKGIENPGATDGRQKERQADEKRMRDLNYELKQMCRRNRDGSFATQRDRERVLDLVKTTLRSYVAI